MEDKEYGKECKRHRISIRGENFYLIIGDNFVQPTVPYENRPDNETLRDVVETLCRKITEIQGGES